MTILFYQSDIVENMLNQYQYTENFEAILEFEQSKNISPKEVNLTAEPALSYVSQYESPSTNKNLSESTKSDFRKIHCEKGHLVNKGQVVKADMAEHIFPEIEFHNEKCNLCDPTCNFSVIEKQLNALLSEEFLSKSGRG
jgi:dTDP-4-dehydrorhamnose reductase